MDVTPWNRTTGVSTIAERYDYTTTEESPSNYDHEGAMKFIISTILVYSLLGIVTMMLSRLRKKSNDYRRQLDDDVTHFIKTGNRLRQSFHRQQLIFRRNTFVKMIKTKETMEAYGMDVEEGGDSSTASDRDSEEARKLQHADDHIPKVTFHIEDEVRNEPESLEELKLPLKTLTDSSCQTDDDLCS